MESFAKNLRARIQELGLTHAEAARRCNLEVRRFHHYVIGDREPDLKTLLKIAEVLDSTADKLLRPGNAENLKHDDAARLRAKLSAATQTLDAASLRLLMILVDGVIAYSRTNAKPPASRGQTRYKGRGAT